jgi:hypothetical protein
LQKSIVTRLRPTVGPREESSQLFSGLGLPLRDADIAHDLVDLAPPAHKDRVVAWRVATITADGECGIDGKPFSRFEPRFVEATQFRQGYGEVEMRDRKIPVGLDRAAQFPDRFFILGKKDFHRSVEAPPKIDGRIARAQPQRILDVIRSLFAMANKILCQTM